MALHLVSALAVELGDRFATLVNLLTALLEPARDFLGLQPPLAQLQLCLVLLALVETQRGCASQMEPGASLSDLASVILLLRSFQFQF